MECDFQNFELLMFELTVSHLSEHIPVPTVHFPSASSMLRTVDESVSPCTDFYQHTCGTLLRTTVIPDDKTSKGVTTEADNRIQQQVKGTFFVLSTHTRNIENVSDQQEYQVQRSHCQNKKKN